MISERTMQVLINCRAKALGAPAPDWIAMRDPAFHAELLAESAIRLVRFRLAQAQQRHMSRVLIPKAVVRPEEGPDTPADDWHALSPLDGEDMPADSQEDKT